MAEQQSKDPQKQGRVKNPYIVNFCKVLVEKKGENLEPAVKNNLLDKMYSLLECMLGQNMIKALPEELRTKYLTIAEDLKSLDYDKIGEIFDSGVQNYEQIMKSTMKEFAEIFMKNAKFDMKDYPVPAEACQA